jgi:hypothetical protein
MTRDSKRACGINLGLRARESRRRDSNAQGPASGSCARQGALLARRGREGAEGAARLGLRAQCREVRERGGGGRERLGEREWE